MQLNVEYRTQQLSDFVNAESDVRSSASHLLSLTHLMPQSDTCSCCCCDDGSNHEYYKEEDLGWYKPCY